MGSAYNLPHFRVPHHCLNIDVAAIIRKKEGYDRECNIFPEMICLRVGTLSVPLGSANNLPDFRVLRHNLNTDVAAIDVNSRKKKGYDRECNIFPTTICLRVGTMSVTLGSANNLPDFRVLRHSLNTDVAAINSRKKGGNDENVTENALQYMEEHTRSRLPTMNFSLFLRQRLQFC